MAFPEQKPQRKREDVFKEFRELFFSMNRLTSFPWTVSRRRNVAKGGRKLVDTSMIQTQTVGCLLVGLMFSPSGSPCRLSESSLDLLCFPQPNGGAVSLLENVALISEGTTGLVTWEAALHLAEWALENQQLFSGRSVLELGSGVGLTGIAVCCSCDPLRFVFSDCHPAVLQKLRENVRLNGFGEQTSPAVSVEELDWTTATEEQIRRIGADVVLAADVVYDPEAAGSLAALMLKILSCGPAEVYVCSTVRNPQTYGGFKLQLGKHLAHQRLPWKRSG
uniref:Eukaryotic elongation factor 2 lysine methyltransferase n=1 Tax=Cyprinodon variegatus TaxID=28743 RepID=A0A3Q2CF96_CYPVA